MINKKVNNVHDALKGIENGMTIMLGGFGLCGIPENSIAELVQKNTTDLTCISNNAGVDEFDINAFWSGRDNTCLYIAVIDEKRGSYLKVL